MVSGNKSKQIRIKLYLPHTANDKTPQIIIMFVEKGSPMALIKDFLQNHYPKNMLKGKIKQICIADDDGEIDEDFPPINENQDITSLGVSNFWIDRIFDHDDTQRASIVYSEKKHRGTMKERLLSSSDTISDSEYTSKSSRCCWCCCASSKYNAYDSDSDDEDLENPYKPPAASI